ncbi:MAG: D-alanyl-D-alanine carboxypeptidase, partial [Pseudomonadota bacterium]
MRVFFLVSLAVLTGATGAAAQLFETRAEHAILLDVETRSVLFNKDADAQVPPASLAKLMTMEVVFHALKTGQ